MTCNGCQALRGPLVKLESNVTLTVTGFGLQELLRVTVPPLDDPVKIVAVSQVSSLLTATTANLLACIAPAGGTILNALDSDSLIAVPFTDASPGGPNGRRSILQAWVESPGDYVLSVTKQSGNGQAVASSLSPIQMWWER